ncbi:response regulator transcription factor [bacterium]|nr:response regulator transcription factor [bacterium]MDC1468078.1 response regulator transcription factor [Planktomarina temperata]
MTQIIIVDDEVEILAPLEQMLTQEGYHVSAFSSSLAAQAHLQQHSVDLAIFDIKMPEMDGFSLLKSVRAKMPNLPIIFLSSKAEEQDQIIGFTLGADDYITKPFSKHLLLFRVAAVLRRHSVGAVLDAPVRAGQLTIDQDRHLVTWATMAVDLTVTECLLLLAMAQRPGVVKTRNQLMDAAYREAIYVSDRTIDSHIRNIRQKLKAVDPTCDIISTVHGLGYRLQG